MICDFLTFLAIPFYIILSFSNSFRALEKLCVFTVTQIYLLNLFGQNGSEHKFTQSTRYSWIDINESSQSCDIRLKTLIEGTITMCSISWK